MADAFLVSDHTRKIRLEIESGLRGLPVSSSQDGFLLWISILIALNALPDKLPNDTPSLEALATTHDDHVPAALRQLLSATVDAFVREWGLDGHAKAYAAIIRGLPDAELRTLRDTMSCIHLPREPRVQRDVAQDLLYDILRMLRDAPKRPSAWLIAGSLQRTFGLLARPDIRSIHEVNLSTHSALPALIRRWPTTDELELSFQEPSDPLSLLHAHLFLRSASSASRMHVHTETPTTGEQAPGSQSSFTADLVVAVAPSKGLASGGTQFGFLEPIVEATALTGVAAVILPATFLYRAADEPIRAALMEADLLVAAFLASQRHLPLYETNAALLLLSKSKPVMLRRQVAVIDSTRRGLHNIFSNDRRTLGDMINGQTMMLEDREGVTWGQTVTLSEAERWNHSLSLATYSPSTFEPATDVEEEIEALQTHSLRIKELLSKAESHTDRLIAAAGLRGGGADE